MIITTGERAATLAISTSSSSPAKTSSLTGEKTRKAIRKTSGAGETAVRNIRATRARWYAAAAPAPTSTATRTWARPLAPETIGSSAWTANSATSTATNSR